MYHFECPLPHQAMWFPPSPVSHHTIKGFYDTAIHCYELIGASGSQQIPPVGPLAYWEGCHPIDDSLGTTGSNHKACGSTPWGEVVHLVT